MFFRTDGRRIFASKEGSMYVRIPATRASGLWFAKRYSREKGVWHFAVLDFSGWLVRGGIFGGVIELLPDGPSIREVSGSESWEFLEEIHDVAGALRRLRHALALPHLHTYSALGNNCESFARWIAFGRRESHQVRDGILLAAGLTLVIGAVRRKPARKRRSRRT